MVTNQRCQTGFQYRIDPCCPIEPVKKGLRFFFRSALHGALQRACSVVAPIAYLDFGHCAPPGGKQRCVPREKPVCGERLVIAARGVQHQNQLGSRPVWPRSIFLASSLDYCRDPLRLPIDAHNRNPPTGDQINTGNKFNKKRWQELPVPAKKVNQDRCHAQVEEIVSGRSRALDEKGEDNELEHIGDHGQNHCSSQARSRRNGDGVLSHVNLSQS
jgi:hypothetical protein